MTRHAERPGLRWRDPARRPGAWSRSNSQLKESRSCGCRERHTIRSRHTTRTRGRSHPRACWVSRCHSRVSRSGVCSGRGQSLRRRRTIRRPDTTLRRVPRDLRSVREQLKTSTSRQTTWRTLAPCPSRLRQWRRTIRPPGTMQFPRWCRSPERSEPTRSSAPHQPGRQVRRPGTNRPSVKQARVRLRLSMHTPLLDHGDDATNRVPRCAPDLPQYAESRCPVLTIGTAITSDPPVRRPEGK